MTLTVRIQIQKEASADDLPLPRYATPGAAGLDLYAAIDVDLILAPGSRAKVSTGIRLAIPEGYEAQVRPRSGLAWRHGLGMLNSPGTIDSDYRGVVSVLFMNWGEEAVTIHRGDRIAQIIVAPIVQVEWAEDREQPLTETQRHEGGFGHTGVE